MKKLTIFLFSIVSVFPLFACQKTQVKTNEVDNKSYINDFELSQENTKNNTSIKITSPQASLDPTNNNIEITDSSIDILNTKGIDINIISGKSLLNNYKNLIRVYDDVKISLVNSKNSYIKTDSFDWDLSKSTMDLNNPLDISFDNTVISSSSGLYNIDLGQLELNNNIFNRNVFNKEGEQIYQIKIIADLARWYKDGNSLEFSSNDKQVEATVDFLSIK